MRNSAEHTVMWWTLFLATLIGGLIMAMMEDAEGAGTPEWRPDAAIDENPVMIQTQNHICRGPDNILRWVYADDDYEIMISYTANNGTTWTNETVMEDGWEGSTLVNIGGIVTLGNNTTIIGLYVMNGPDYVYNWYLAIKWNWTGDWEYVPIYGSDSTGVGYLKIAWNGTKILLMGCSGGNTLRWKTYEPSTGDLNNPVNNLPTQWIGAWNYANDFDLTVNQSADFIICSKSWSGSDYRYMVRDLELNHVAVYWGTGSGVLVPYGCQIACTSEDTFVTSAWIWYNALSRGAIWHGHMATPWSAFTKFYINYEIWRCSFYSVGMCIDVDDKVTMYFVDGDEALGDPLVGRTYGTWDGTEAEFEANMTYHLYDWPSFDPDDDWYVAGYYDNIYPKVGGYSVNLPNGGWMGGHIWQDEQGSPDDYRFALYDNVTSFHWYDWGEEEPPSPPGGGGGSEDWAGDDEGPWTLAADGEFMTDLWTLFIVTAVFVGLATAYRKYTDRLTGWRYGQRRWRRFRRPIWSGTQRYKRRSRVDERRYRY